ncbi:hypothetical protein FD723_18660 [Nostoc sp. C052]|uniref:hypothetical protein n=1 Tax=Nostoc sp. C052 TaxID=2576902 RepID=UPI0015C3F9B4|nr:hypothetical protein [Nostoc sp. C052]QLE42242.1 hypothetical protein FD723_18660 [Nostoc sp. C052]
MAKSIDELRLEYHALAHAMQSGVAMKMNYEPGETTPKHLRVGVNSTMVETGALAALLIAKGVFTEEEYYQALVQSMQNEVNLYKEWLRERLGNANIELG